MKTSLPSHNKTRVTHLTTHAELQSSHRTSITLNGKRLTYVLFRRYCSALVVPTLKTVSSRGTLAPATCSLVLTVRKWGRRVDAPLSLRWSDLNGDY
ncbi:hypothetical protein QQG55_39415 [Brugia pahangi]